MKEHHIEVARTARYFTYGTPSEKTEQIWFGLHGYGMLANSLVKRFSVLDPEKHFVIAPEALSRFYWGGFDRSKVVASWMTSEDRLNEIKDYISYLDTLYEYIFENNKFSKDAIVNALGFSQGTATCARWLINNKSKVKNMIFWAGPLPHDVEWNKATPVFQQSKVLFVLGNQDQFITQEHRKDHEAKLNKLDFKYESMSFDGKHDIDGATLLKVADWCK